MTLIRFIMKDGNCSLGNQQKCPIPFEDKQYRFTESIIKEKTRNNDINFLPVGFIHPSSCFSGERIQDRKSYVNF